MREWIKVSAEVMLAIGQWVSETGRIITSEDAESWDDAPDSRWRYGIRALEGPGQYSKVRRTLFDEWQDATGAQTRTYEGFSDRTGDYTYEGLV